MFLTEKELPIEVAKIDGIQVNNVNLAKAGEHEVFEKLATNSSSSDHQHTRLMKYKLSDVTDRLADELYLLDLAIESTQRLL